MPVAGGVPPSRLFGDLRAAGGGDILDRAAAGGLRTSPDGLRVHRGLLAVSDVGALRDEARPCALLRGAGRAAPALPPALPPGDGTAPLGLALAFGTGDTPIHRLG